MNTDFNQPIKPLKNRHKTSLSSTNSPKKNLLAPPPQNRPQAHSQMQSISPKSKYRRETLLSNQSDQSRALTIKSVFGDNKSFNSDNPENLILVERLVDAYEGNFSLKRQNCCKTR